MKPLRDQIEIVLGVSRLTGAIQYSPKGCSALNNSIGPDSVEDSTLADQLADSPWEGLNSGHRVAIPLCSMATGDCYRSFAHCSLINLFLLYFIYLVFLFYSRSFSSDGQVLFYYSKVGIRVLLRNKTF